MKNRNLPELLCPAGSVEALHAAIDGGADAVYMGGTSFNARINAKNFTFEDMRECADLSHKYGAKLYQTLNIQVYDKEIDTFIRDAYKSAECGVDAFIVADMGAAALLSKYVPEIPLHASTQLSIHNADGAKIAEKLGFTRLVPARELSIQNIKTLVDSTPLEIEIFVHGALCVSHSGQCLFSSLVGGRSGNRGLCAQPCRLPYTCKNSKKPEYPLSLKDLSVAEHIDDIIDLGVHSLKIEGRMKSPEYVNTVARVWRRLLDEHRNANKTDMQELSDAFSRGGFTDGYFTSNITKKMLGVRSEGDKQISRELDKFNGIKRKIPMDMGISIKKDTPVCLSVSAIGKNVTVIGDIPDASINMPIDAEVVKKQLSRLGNTPYHLSVLNSDIDDGLIYPLSKLNAIRRDAIEKLEAECDSNTFAPSVNLPEKIRAQKSEKTRESKNSARFLSPSQITESAKEYFDEIFLPLEKYESIADGFVMPPVVLDSEKEHILSLVDSAINKGAKIALVANVGQIEMLKDKNIKLVGDYRFNVMNNQHVVELDSLGISEIILSPELTLPQIRDIGGNSAVIVYGRIPLMTLEKCVIRDIYGCDACNKATHDSMLTLTDRRGYIFPIAREFCHRNVIYNSMPTSMSDKRDDLFRANIKNRHFIFTTETNKDINNAIAAFKNSTPIGGVVRRI